MTDLRWPWVSLALGVVLVVLILLWARWPARSSRALLVAHTARLRALPRYRTLARRELLVAALGSTGALLLVAGCVLLVGRPVREVWTEPDRSGRDVQLCLDVSASMDRWNQQVVDSFRQLLAELSGERVGLTIFSGAAVAVFPLTDDYTYVRAKLDQAEAAFRTSSFEFFVGAETVADRASQVGDGLVSCVQRLGPAREGRGRAIVLASDNEPIGKPVFTLPQAARHATRHEAVVYGIGTPDLLRDRQRQRTFEAAVESTGGTLSIVEDDGSTKELLEGIQRLERDRLAPRPTGTWVDDPAAGFWIATAGLVLLLAGALARRRP